MFDFYSRGMDGFCLLNGIVVLLVFYFLEDICVFFRKFCVFLSVIIFLEVV